MLALIKALSLMGRGSWTRPGKKIEILMQAVLVEDIEKKIKLAII
jgi:hypothetical protein